MNGLTVAISNKNGDRAGGDGNGFGFQYGTKLSVFDVKLAVANGATSSGADEISQSLFGFGVGVGNLSVLVETNPEDRGDDNEYTSSGFGATYQLSNSLGLVMFSRSADVNDNNDSTNNEYAFTALSVSYTLAPGLKADVTSSSSSFGEDVSGSSLAATFKARF